MIEENHVNNVTEIPTFSVIMPAYNTEKFVKESLESLVTQSCQDFEVIFIDDGSIDNTAAIARSILSDWGGSYTFIMQRNQGVGRARNTGIDHARGEYLFFLDSDDVAAPGLLSRISEKIAFSRPDIIATGWRRIDEEGQKLYEGEGVCFYGSELSRDPSVRILQYIRCDVLLWIGGFCTKRSLIKRNGIGFFTRLPIHDDVFFMLKSLFSADSSVLIDEELAYYRKRAGALTQSPKYKDLALRAEIHVMNEFGRIISQSGSCHKDTMDYYRKRRCLAYLNISKLFVLNGEEHLFYRSLKESVFRTQLSDLFFSSDSSINDRFKSFLALYFPAIYCLRYRYKRKKQLKAL